MLTGALRELHPPRDPDPPATFGLSPDEVRRHANALARAGWSMAEVQQRLDVEPARRS